MLARLPPVARLGLASILLVGVVWLAFGRGGEALYLSDEPEASLLLRDDVRRAEAQAIADAVVDWVASPYAGSGYLSPLVATESAGGGGGSAECEDPEVVRAQG